MKIKIKKGQRKERTGDVNSLLSQMNYKCVWLCVNDIKFMTQ